MSLFDWLALVFAAMCLGFSVINEIKDIKLCEIAVDGFAGLFLSAAFPVFVPSLSW